MPLPSSRSEHSPRRDRGIDPGIGARLGRDGQEPDANLFGHKLIRPKRFAIPHPLVAALGVAGVFAIYRLGQARGFGSMLDYAPWLIGFLVIFSYVSRWSARREALKRQQELERLRNAPVWNLDGDDRAGKDQAAGAGDGDARDLGGTRQ